MDSYLYTNITIQVIACIDTTGKITPLRFRFLDRNGELVTVRIDRILSSDQEPHNIGITFSCSASIFGRKKQFSLYYSHFSGKWIISRVGQ